MLICIFPDSKELGLVIKKQRKSLGLTQTHIALACGVGLRFLSELENGKATCQIGKTLLVIESLGLKIDVSVNNL